MLLELKHMFNIESAEIIYNSWHVLHVFKIVIKMQWFTHNIVSYAWIV